MDSVRKNTSPNSPYHTRFLMFLFLAMIAGVQSKPVLAATPQATTTDLAVTSNGASVTDVQEGAPVTFTASVTSGSMPVTTGQVTFCNATAPLCTDINLLGTAQLSTTGTATLPFHPTPGSHSYKAIYLGTPNGATAFSGSSSTEVPLNVIAATTTSIQQNGFAGSYTLTATVAGSGPSAAPTGTVSFLDTSDGNRVLGTALLGNGIGGMNLVNRANFPAGRAPMAVSDFNGDGNSDLAITSQSGDSITILLSNGDGTFRTAATLAVSLPDLIAAGDFNGDGNSDLAITSLSRACFKNRFGLKAGTYV